MKKENELNKFITDITGNLDIYTKDFHDLEILEQDRINTIRKVINIIIKLYNNESLNEEEIKLLDTYKYNYDYKDIEKSISYIVYKIDEEYSNIAYLLYIKGYNTGMNKHILDNSWKYIYNLRRIYNDLLHSITHDHEISLLDIYNNSIKPKINVFKRKKYK